MNENLHSGHRQRMKAHFLEEGGKGISDHTLLEMLLYYSIPRRDTNEIAHRLIEHFGSFYGVFEAAPEELMQICGVTQNSAVLIKLMLDCCRRYFDQRVSIADDREENVLSAIARKVIARCIGLTHERLFIICLDNRSQIHCFEELGDGTPDNVQVICRRVAESAIRHNCAAVVLAHNHPGGFALPSRADVTTTLRLRDTLAAISIRLLDHIIVAGNDYVSLAQTGVFDRISFTDAEMLNAVDDLSPQEF